MAPQGSHNREVFGLFTEIGIINQLASARFERSLPHALTLSQFGVLNHFARLGGERSPKALASAFQVTKGAMTNTLGKLAAKRFINVRPSEVDGRSKVVTITDAGLQAREAAIAASAQAMADVVAEISPAVLERLMAPLQEIRQYLDTHRT